MNISNELLAAYAAGNVTNDERNAVRQYLAEHPQELESVMMMMDEDYELDLDDAEENNSFVDGQHGADSFHDIALSAAAFAPQMSCLNHNSVSRTTSDRSSFNQQLDELLDDIGI